MRAKQQIRSAKLARYKRELAQAGVKLSLPKPSAKVQMEKGEELKRLYLELFPEAAAKKEESETSQEAPAEEPKAEENPQAEEKTSESAGSEETSKSEPEPNKQGES